MKTRIATVLASLLAAAPAHAAETRTAAYTGRQAAVLLRQCSRPAPASGEGWFTPTGAQIEALERAVVERSRGTGGMEPQDHVVFGSLADLRARYAVETVGIVRRGARYVYGSFLPLNGAGAQRSASGPTIVCDGGIALFGAEYDVRTGRLDHFAENGPR